MTKRGTKIKKLLALLLCILLLAAMFAGCSENEAAKGATDATKTEPTESSSTQGSSDLIVYTQKTLDQYFHVALQERVEYAAKEAGYEIEVTNCNNDSAVQVTQMQNTIAKNPKAIIANSVDSDGFNDAVEQAVAAGIPVVEVDNPASTAIVDAVVAFGNYELGEIAAEQIANRLEAKYGEAKGLVVDVYGAMSSECWRLRKEGFDSKMKEYPNITVVETPGEGEQAKSQDALTNVIAQYGSEIDAVFCPSDAPGIGCAEALQMANMWFPIGEDGHVIFVTGDGEPSSVQGIRDGYYDCTIVEDAYAYGPIAVDLLVDYVFKGEKVPTSGTYTNENFFWKTAEFSESATGPKLTIPPYVLDADNIDQDGHWGVAALEAGG